MLFLTYWGQIAWAFGQALLVLGGVFAILLVLLWIWNTIEDYLRTIDSFKQKINAIVILFGLGFALFTFLIALFTWLGRSIHE